MDKIFKNLSWNLFGKFLRIFLNVIILAKIVEFIGYEQFGILTVLLTHQSYFAIISTLGAEVNYGKTLVKKTYSNMLSSIFFIKIIVTSCTVFALIGLGIEKLNLISVIAGGLAIFNLIDIQLSAKHLHKNFIKVSIFSSLSSFLIKIVLIELFQSKTLLIYFLLFENCFISIYYLLTSKIQIKLKLNYNYTKVIIRHSFKFVCQRLLYVISTTLLLLLFQHKIDPIQFGKIALSFKIVGFCYVIFAAMTSSFEKLIFGKIKKLKSFCLMYRTTLYMYTGLLILFPVAIQITDFANYLPLNIYLNYENYVAIALSLPYFLMVSVNKWYILNQQYWILLITNISIIVSTCSFTYFVNDASLLMFWSVWFICFSIGIMAGFVMDSRRNRHLKILRRSSWLVWKY